ncbi:E2.3.2.15 [Mytilus edulis]|uniref:glutathione gamma-glutamylcysteinyltransferase n=1 Tax=Mytilus edulis TaxID=6550 RepID=A0A8S3RG23_MYTED|nr:E2.3.2.15 [Mytilus edulis]
MEPISESVEKKSISDIKDTPKLQFYRRKLPDSCIPFSSPEGKKIFQEALLFGHMECYFKLAAQFRTQDEPAFCGLSTLVMVLNALEIDPEQVWKGPWRWYHENMLDCCVPVKVIEQDGINLGQFVCLAECNGLETKMIIVDENATLENFREVLLKYTKQDEYLITLSYSRKVLSQTGDGHFSPVGGYHVERDLVLILDTARFKYPPHWVSASLIFEAMQGKDKSTGKPRGYVIMNKKPSSRPLLLFRFSDQFGLTLEKSCTKSNMSMLSGWKAWLSEPCDSCVNIEGIIANAVIFLLKEATTSTQQELIFTTQLDIKCCQGISDQHLCSIKTLIDELQDHEVYKLVDATFSAKFTNTNCEALFGTPAVSFKEPSGSMKCVRMLKSQHFITLLLLCSPYQVIVDTLQGTTGAMLNTFLLQIMGSEETKYLKNEIGLLKKQFTVLFCSYKSCCK